MSAFRMTPARRAALIVTIGSLLAAGAGCDRDASARHARGDVRQSTLPAVQAAPKLPTRFGTIGRTATAAEIRDWNIDVNGSGVGLPPGQGTYARGAALFAERCAACHGARGEGIPPFPKLIGREPREGFPFGRDARYAKTIGNYWPYATTVYDYIDRAMPFPAPGSLKPDEIYSLVEFLLAENEIVDRGTVMDARTLRNVRMPAHDRFVVDNRTGGAGFR